MTRADLLTHWITPLYDAAVRIVPLPVVLVLWGLAAGCVTMLLYAALSPQQRLADIDERLTRVARAARNATTYAEVVQASSERVRLALGRLLGVLLPAAIAAAPVVLSTLWLESHLSVRRPAEHTPVIVTFTPADHPLVWQTAAGSVTLRSGDSIAWPSEISPGVIGDDGGALRITVPFNRGDHFATPHWWSLLSPGLSGYVDPRATVTTVAFALAPVNVVGSDLAVLRLWYAWFFVPLGVAALSLKFALKIR